LQSVKKEHELQIAQLKQQLQQLEHDNQALMLDNQSQQGRIISLQRDLELS
jgi:cytochrome c-type biogenesis protein CcmH/NrfG